MQKLYIEEKGLKIEVKVIKEKTDFGHRQFLVIPVAGSGERWINEESLLNSVDPKKIVRR